MGYLVIKNGTNKKSYRCTNTCNKPRLRVSNSYVPITKSSKPTMRARVNGSYIADYKSYTYTGNKGTVTTGTTYLTRTETTGTTYQTRSSTSETIYLTTTKTYIHSNNTITSKATSYNTMTSRSTRYSSTDYVMNDTSLRYFKIIYTVRGNSYGQQTETCDGTMYLKVNSNQTTWNLTSEWHSPDYRFDIGSVHFFRDYASLPAGVVNGGSVSGYATGTLRVCDAITNNITYTITTKTLYSTGYTSTTVASTSTATTGTSYGTRSSTSGTSYGTRSSTSGTSYGTKTTNKTLTSSSWG